MLDNVSEEEILPTGGGNCFEIYGGGELWKSTLLAHLIGSYKKMWCDIFLLYFDFS